MEIYPGIWRISLPMSGELDSVHSYLIKGDDGLLLVDSGWDSSECWEALVTGLAEAGVVAGRDTIDRLLITHEHPDHIGMAGRIKIVFHSQIHMHSSERVYIRPRYEEPAALLSQVTEWLRSNGVPADNLALLRDASLSMTGRNVPETDVYLDGGEVLQVGELQWRVIWTPGHAAGHICLYEPQRRLLISGEQVLPKESSNISLHPQSSPNPLGDYLDSLYYLQGLPTDLVLPAHGEPITDLQDRIAHLINRHLQRAEEVRAAVQSGPKTGWEVAHYVSWKGGRVKFVDLGSWAQRMAVMEALAHLEWIRSFGKIRKDFSTGVIRYFADTGHGV